MSGGDPTAEARGRPRVAVIGTFDPSFHRNRVLRALLERTRFRLDVRPVPLWGPRRDEDLRRGKLRLLLRAPGAFLRLLWHLFTAPRPDLFLAAYPGHFDMPLIALAARLRRVPVVLDLFLSIHDTVVSDRRMAAPGSLAARATAAIDRLACRLADRVLVDTPPHGAFVAARTGVPEERFQTLWIGAQEDVFRPLAGVAPAPGRVLFYGTFIPLHGVDVILRAAARLSGTDVRFRIIGSGQERPAAERLMRELGLRNVELLEPVSRQEIARQVARATLCLGIFGTTGKASRVVPNKLFECLAMGRPVVTADTPAIGAAFAPEEVATVPPGDDAALAETIRALLDDEERREELARRGQARFRRDYDQAALARLLERHLDEAMAEARR